MMRRIPQTLTVLLTATMLSACGQASDPIDRYDIIISGGRVLDGSGTPAYEGDVAIDNGKIVKIGNLAGAKADHTVNATGRLIAPGFIDLHSHADRQILDQNQVINNLHQGITTVLAGNCGGSPLDVGDFATALDARKTTINIGLLIGHNTVRKAVMARDNRAPSAEEQAQMQQLVADAMAEGAFGMSTGLKYIPGAFAETAEVVELAKVAGSMGGIYASHMRDEGLGLLASVEETIHIGAAAGLPVHISHHKVVGAPMWGASVQSLAMVDEARANGIRVTLDQYPYSASNTGLSILIPAWALAGTLDDFKARLQDPETRKRIKDGIIDNIVRDRGGNDPRRVYVSTFAAQPEIAGKNLAEISILRGRTDSIADAAETLMELHVEGEDRGRGVFHAMDEDDVRRIMQYPYVSIATDGNATTFGAAVPHPRNYGTFPRVLGHYSRDERVLDMAEAVRKMTSLPAMIMGLDDRGLIAEGYVADIVLIDPDSVIDKATFEDPHQYAEGIPTVIVRGQIVLENGARTDAYPGGLLYGPAYTGQTN